MKNSFAKISLVAFLTLLSACDYPAPPYGKPGTPESLLDVSSENITVGLGSKKALSRLSQMVKEDRPVGAELKCSLKNSRCAQAKEIFERNSVPVQLSTEKGNTAVLVYDRVVARECDQRYVDNMSGSRSFNHPAFGCAMASNMVQMVSDKHQFTNPALLDFPDAEKGNQSYKGYLGPSSERKTKNAEWSTGVGSK